MLRWFWLSLSATLAIGCIMLFWSLPFIAREAGGLWPFDIRLAGYSEAEARFFLQNLSDEGRHFYLTVQHRLDVIFPILLAVTLMLAARLLFHPRFAAAFSLPILMATSFDFFENRLVAEMLHGTQFGIDPVMIEGAAMWTVLKAITTGGVLVVLLAGSLRLLWVKGWSLRGA